MSLRGLAPAPIAPAELIQRVARALDDAPAAPLVLCHAAHAVDPLALLAPGDDAFLWMDRDGHVNAGRGRAFGIGAAGQSRFAQVAERARALRESMRVVSIDGTEPMPPRFFGGAAFVAGAASDADWSAFGDAHFEIPQIAWIDDERSGPRLQLAIREPGSRDARRILLNALEELLARPPHEPAAMPELQGDVLADTDRHHWHRLVERALDTIHGGTASKIVLARSVRFRSARPIEAQSLASVLRGAKGSYRYVVRIGDTIFAGASPERLIQRAGDRIRTEAVAGTSSIDVDEPLEGEKEQREHLAVVLAIDEALAPVCLALEHAEEPRVRMHDAIVHLVTPFEGRVDADVHVLALVEQLHPTPAVAGTPRDVALDFVTRSERMKRGWYAGPIGWFDLTGDGELAVALRCVRTDGTTLDAFAGAGIVQGSDADAEFDETALKMRAALHALGVTATP